MAQLVQQSQKQKITFSIGEWSHEWLEEPDIFWVSVSLGRETPQLKALLHGSSALSSPLILTHLELGWWLSHLTPGIYFDTSAIPPCYNGVIHQPSHTFARHTKCSTQLLNKLSKSSPSSSHDLDLFSAWFCSSTLGSLPSHAWWMPLVSPLLPPPPWTTHPICAVCPAPSLSLPALLALFSPSWLSKPEALSSNGCFIPSVSLVIPDPSPSLYSDVNQIRGDDIEQRLNLHFGSGNNFVELSE